MRDKTTRGSSILYVVLSVIALVIWICFLFFALFLGGSPGPGYDRTVPYIYVGIIALGVLGAVIGLTAGIKGTGEKPAGKILPVCSAVLGAIGSVPFFLLELTAAGIIALLVGVLPDLLHLVLTRKH